MRLAAVSRGGEAMLLERERERLREHWRRRRPPVDAATHAAAAVGWLHRAQDANGDGGVSHSYLLGKGWMRSYPETTGYIIPTLLNWSASTGDADSRRRALDMARWELQVQQQSGAIPNLTDGQPVVFDTGQVLFGWLSAHGATGEASFVHAARRGGDWLLAVLDADGVWRHSGDAGGPGRTYNVCVAWALLALTEASGEPRYGDAVRRFLAWTLEQEREHGWFERNCLNDDTAPLLHTIAYTARGQLECGVRLGDAALVAAASRTAAALAAQVDARGRLAGRFARGWRPAARWACLTGMAQMSIVWRRLQELQAVSDTEAATGVAAARRVNDFLCRTQDRSAANVGLRGGIRGSYPIQGDYGRYRVLNWATKYFIDALLYELPQRHVPFPY
jgi:hypothetical protein